jgi:ubiquinone biosynthesis protein
MRPVSLLLALLRLPSIAWHLGRAGVLGHLAAVTLLPAWLRQLCHILDKIIRSGSATADAGGALANALMRLGPGFIKFGQALSTRADLIGPDMGRALAQLQDRLPPFPAAVARRLVASQSGKPLEDSFASFDDAAVAAASIAQVHRATLCDGRKVAVKLLRPGIERRMRADTDLFDSLAHILEWLAPGLRRLKLVEAVAQFREISDTELDFRLEAAAGGRLKDNLADDAGIYVPWIDLEHSTSRMLIIEWIDGIRIDDVAGLHAAGHDVAKVTEIAAGSFFNQVFRDGYFHADMHPGNIFIRDDGVLVPIDFGIMGYLEFSERLFLARLLSAMLERDYDEVAQLHKNAGMLKDSISVHQFSQAIRAVADPVMGKALGDVSLATVLGQILQISTRFEIEIQPEFNLLQKTMMMAEGVARQLNPQADMWQLAKPLAQDWMAQEANLSKQAGQAVKTILALSARLPAIFDALEQMQPSSSRPSSQPSARPSRWPLGLAILALGLAILSFFTHFH